ncbi:hypothetical protein AHAS_Ahas06G0074500 [Arachis hypogaea]
MGCYGQPPWAFKKPNHVSELQLIKIFESALLGPWRDELRRLLIGCSLMNQVERRQMIRNQNRNRKRKTHGQYSVVWYDASLLGFHVVAWSFHDLGETSIAGSALLTIKQCSDHRSLCQACGLG